MIATADSPVSPVQAAQPQDDPSGRARPGWTFALYYRRSRAEPWSEVYRHESAESLWRWSLEMPSGHYREALVRTDLFETGIRGGR